MNKNAIRRRRRGSGGSLSGVLFSASEPGFTFEPWDITTLYQDRAGTTPVTAAGQSVGYRRDKSGRGNHQVAVSDAKRGVYGWMPKTGRRNLLTYSDPNASLPTGWAAFNAAGTNSRTLVSAFGAIAAQYPSHKAIRFETTTGRAGIGQVISVTAGVPYALTCYVAPGGVSTGDGGAIVLWAYGASTGVNVTKSITDADANDRITLSFTPASSGTVDIVYGAGAAATVTADVTMTAPQLVVGSTTTAYQRVVSQYDITEAGVPTCYYVQADGVDDAYVTPTITPNTDKVQVFAGVRKLSEPSYASIISLSPDINANNGAFEITNAVPPTGSLFGAYGWRPKGTVGTFVATARDYFAPITNVVTFTADISGDAQGIRVDGSQKVATTDDQGTGNYLAYPAYIYSRGGTALPFNGLDFGHAVRFGPNLDAATIARVESLIARNTPEVDFLFGGIWNDGYAWNDNTNWNDGA